MFSIKILLIYVKYRSVTDILHFLIIVCLVADKCLCRYCHLHSKGVMSALFVDVYTKDSEVQLTYKHERTTQGLLHH